MLTPNVGGGGGGGSALYCNETYRSSSKALTSYVSRARGKGGGGGAALYCM